MPENILLITIDTLRADHLGCYGNRSVQTPNLDALAARGTRFSQAVTAVPLTLPAHASILTGTYPPVHGVRDMGGFVLGESPPTLATLLGQKGFETAAFVGSFTLDHRFGIGRGFQTYDDRMPAADPSSPGHEPEVRAEVVVERAVAWLEGRTHGRFFCGFTSSIRIHLTTHRSHSALSTRRGLMMARLHIRTCRLAGS